MDSWRHVDRWHLFGYSCCRTVLGAELQLLILHFFGTSYLRLTFKDTHRNHFLSSFFFSIEKLFHVNGSHYNECVCVQSGCRRDVRTAIQQRCLWAEAEAECDLPRSDLKKARQRGSLVGLNPPHYLLSGALWLLPKANWFTPGRFGACTVIAVRKRNGLTVASAIMWQIKWQTQPLVQSKEMRIEVWRVESQGLNVRLAVVPRHKILVTPAGLSLYCLC